MNKQDYLKILKLAQSSLKEYENWGETELPKQPKQAKADVASLRAAVENRAKKKQAEPVSSDNNLETLKQEICSCQKCALGKTRLNVVFGEGSASADIMFIGEGPGFSEDHEGRPFIGRAGQLLTKIIEAMGEEYAKSAHALGGKKFTREDVFIANIVKCHPMKNPSDPELRANDRPPTPEEMAACKPYLDKQIELIKPKVLCTLGSSSTKALLETEESISNLRGIWAEYQNVKLMPTYHPAALLRNPNLKKNVWDDMKKILAYLKTGAV
jgi:DNA polymerase